MDQEFGFLDPQVPIKETRNRLPHWDQADAAYFITFHLGDSLPVKTRREWRERRRQWLIANPKPWNEIQGDEFREYFGNVDQRLLDQGCGSCFLKSLETRSLLEYELMKGNGSAFAHYSWVIMPNHVHILTRIYEDSRLSKTIQFWKGASSRSINKRLGRSGKFWEDLYMDTIIRDYSHFTNCLRYIRNNPVKAGLGTEMYSLYESELVRDIGFT